MCGALARTCFAVATMEQTILFKGGTEVHFYEERINGKAPRTVFRCVIPPGARTPMPHYHEAFDELVRGHKGVATWVVNGKTTELRPGDELLVPRGATHHFTNRTKETIEFICHVTPELLGAPYFEDVARIVNVDGLPDFDALQLVMRKHGLVPALSLKKRMVFKVLGAISRMRK
jgi:quercetin dioxygenase-like cupin family protein